MWTFNDVCQSPERSLNPRAPKRSNFTHVYQTTILTIQHIQVIGYIAVCLRANGLPTVGNILQDARLASEWPPYTRAYLNRGAAAGVSESAMIGPVLNGVCDVAKEQDDQTGDGSFMAPFHEDIQKPVKCNNDYASGFVLGAVNACSIGGVLRNQGSTIQG